MKSQCCSKVLTKVDVEASCHGADLGFKASYDQHELFSFQFSAFLILLLVSQMIFRAFEDVHELQGIYNKV